MTDHSSPQASAQQPLDCQPLDRQPLDRQPLVLFDFDGTLADTATDLAAAANRQRERAGLSPLPVEQLRPVASQGARGLLRVALDLTAQSPGYEDARVQFLRDYEDNIAVHTRLFPGIAELLAQLDASGTDWGIVTNKATYLTLPLVKHLGLDTVSTVVVCGDTTPHAKPHPAPLLHAASQAGHDPGHCLYVGDDLRDIQAGHAAGMLTIAAAYGYCGDDAPVTTWQADTVADTPEQLWSAIRQLSQRLGAPALAGD